MKRLMALLTALLIVPAIAFAQIKGLEGILPAWLLTSDLIYYAILPFLVFMLVIWGFLRRIGVFPGMINPLIAFFLTAALIPTGAFGYLVAILYSAGINFGLLGIIVLFLIGIFLLPQGEKFSIVVKERIKTNRAWRAEIKSRRKQLDKVKTSVIKESAKSKPNKNKLRDLEKKEAKLEEEIKELKDRLGYV